MGEIFNNFVLGFQNFAYEELREMSECDNNSPFRLGQMKETVIMELT
jgi:hypothetical protein